LHEIEVEDVDLNEITLRAEQIAGNDFKDSIVTSEPGSIPDMLNYIQKNEENIGQKRKYSLNPEGPNPKQASTTLS